MGRKKLNLELVQVKTQYEEYFKNDKGIQGRYIRYLPNGKKLCEYDMKDSLRNGEYFEFDDNDNIMVSAHYIDGLRCGENICYKTNLKDISKIVSYYVNGKLNGWRMHYDNNGDVKYQVYFIDDMAVDIHQAKIKILQKLLS